MTICVDMGATEIKVAPMRKIENEYLLGKTEKFPTNAALGKEGITAALARACTSENPFVPLTSTVTRRTLRASLTINCGQKSSVSITTNPFSPTSSKPRGSKQPA